MTVSPEHREIVASAYEEAAADLDALALEPIVGADDELNLLLAQAVRQGMRSSATYLRAIAVGHRAAGTAEPRLRIVS